MLLKSWHPHKAFQRRSPHLFDVLKPHVVGPQRRDLPPFFVREPHPPGNVPSHPPPNVDMPIETDAIARLLSRFEGRRLTYIVQKNTPRQRWRGPRRQLLDHQPRMDPHIALRAKLWRLFHPLECRDPRQNYPQQPTFPHNLKSPSTSRPPPPLP